MIKLEEFPFLKKYAEHIYVVILAVMTYLVIWLGFFLWEESQKAAVWKLLPDKTIAIIETQSTSSLNELKNEFFQPLFIKNSNTTDITLPSVSEYIFDALMRLIQKNTEAIPSTLSVHAVSKYEFGTVWFMRKDKSTVLIDYISGLDSADFLKKEKRSYSGTTITEFRIENIKEVFSYFEYKNQLICSAYPSLLESVIRTIKKAKKERDFVFLNNKIQFLKYEKKGISLFIKENGIKNLIALYIENNKLDELKYFFDNQLNTIVNVKSDSSDILLKGKVFSTSKNLQYLQLFNGDLKDDSSFLKLIPQQLAHYVRFKFNNGNRLKKKLEDYWKVNDSLQFRKQKQFIESNNQKVKHLYSVFDKELLLVQLASEKDKYCYVQVAEEKGLEENLTAMSGVNISVNSELKQHLEAYGIYDIYYINVPDLPEKLFGKLYQGFPECFATIIDNYLVFGSSVSTLKKVIDTADNINKQYQFIKNKENNSTFNQVSLFIDVFNTWSSINNSLNKLYKESFSQGRRRFLQLNFLSFQLNNEDGRITYHLHKKNSNSKLLEKKPAEVYNTKLFSDVVTKPILVKNHHSQRTEVLLQDKARNICLISENGQLLWKYKLNKEITGEVYQIDRYKNGFLQYTFVAGNKIHLLDRLGRPINGYPIELPPYVNAHNYAVIDFDGKKNYRYLVTDDKGNTYMSSIYGTVLSNWAPRKFRQTLTSPPIHIKASYQNGIVLMHTNGMVNVAKPTGSMHKGFPLLFDMEVNSPAFVKTGNSFRNSNIIFISTQGEMVELNLRGKLKSRKIINSAAGGKNFSLNVNELTDDSFVITNQFLNKVTLYNEKGESVFEKQFTTTNNKAIQYFNFGSNIEIIAVTDKLSHQTYLYNLNGDLLTSEPIKSSRKVAIRYDSKRRQYIVYLNYKNFTYCIKVKDE